MKKSHQKLYDRIEEFLKTKNKSDGGWAKFSDADQSELYDIFNDICALKFEKDADGDLPIQISIINRTQYWPQYFTPMAYETKIPLSRLFRQARYAAQNITIATGQLESCMREIEARTNGRKEETE